MRKPCFVRQVPFTVAVAATPPRCCPQSVKMTLLLSAVAVPINTVFGIQAALFLARTEFKGKTFAVSLLDLPFSISPVITGEWAGGS